MLLARKNLRQQVKEYVDLLGSGGVFDRLVHYGLAENVCLFSLSIALFDLLQLTQSTLMAMGGHVRYQLKK